MGIFGTGQKPDRLFGVRVNQSQYGYPFPVVMGTAQVQQSILWVDGFSSKQAPAGGKGILGGKGDGYIYSADVVAALCCGPIAQTGDVWSGQSWLGIPTATETFTIGSPYTYTPTNADTLLYDLGVAVSNPYSGTYADLGAPSDTVLSGSGLVPLIRVTYGDTLNSGEYSINPTGNVYNFSTADDGVSGQLSYSFALTTITQQVTGIVPAGKTVEVGGTNTFQNDLGVIYASGASEGTAFTRVTGTPTATGTYSVSGSAPATYKFSTGDINANYTITYTITDPNAVPQGEPTQLNFTLNTGTLGQSPYSFLTASYPTDAFGYTGLATVLYQPMDLGESGQIQENRFEVMTPDMFGGGSGILDCNPVQCIGRVLTDSTWGLGVGPIPFPLQCIDNSINGTWGAASATGGTWATGSTAFNWFAAQSFFISPVMDSQDTAASQMSKWLEAGMCAAFYSEGLLKLVPYGDTSAANNGYTWTAPTKYVVALDDTCFIAKDNDDPVKITRTSPHDAPNYVQVQYDSRANQYSPEVIYDWDQAFINRYGQCNDSVQDWDFIHTAVAATFAANLRLKRQLYIRNSYEFSLPYTYAYLEPMDVVTISTTSIWAQGLNNANLGITNLPVRITRIVDDPKEGLQITAEDYPFGAHQPTIYNKQINESEPVVDMFADPGNTEVVMFEATNRLTLSQGNQIWIGCAGEGDSYGSTNIWVSQDNSTYLLVGATTQAARMGELHSTFASGSDPDTTNSCVIDLVENCAAWDAGTDANADSGATLTFVDGEIISYSAVSVTGENQITLGTYIRRGQMGSTISSHSTGGLVLRLDDAIFKYTFDPAWIGQTLYFKFQSVNAFGNNPQSLSSLTPVTFTISGSNQGSIDASSGLVFPSSLTNYPIGANLLPNPGFESNTGGYTLAEYYEMGDSNAYGTYIIDGWYLYPYAGNYGGSSSNLLDVYTSDAYSGKNCLEFIPLNSSQSLPTAEANYQFVGTAQINIQPGQVFFGSLWSNTYLAGSLSLPSGAAFYCYLALMIFAADGTFLAQENIALTTDTSNTWINTTGTYQIATSYSGSSPAYMIPCVVGELSNSSGSTITTSGSQYAVCLIDDVQLSCQLPSSTVLPAGNSSYRPTSNPLTAFDAGSSATIDIASFDMQVSGLLISYNGGSITGLSYATIYYIYYPDPAYLGGAVTFDYTTTKADVLSSNGDFYLGSILTPPSGGAETYGNNDGGTGAQSGNTYVLYPSTATQEGPGTVSNISYANDGNTSTGCTIQGGYSTSTTAVSLTGFPSTFIPISSATLYIKSEGVAATGGGYSQVVYSTNGGATTTTVRSATGWSLTTDAITLNASLNLSQIYVSVVCTGSSAGTSEAYFYEAWIVCTQ